MHTSSPLPHPNLSAWLLLFALCLLGSPAPSVASSSAASQRDSQTFSVTQNQPHAQDQPDKGSIWRADGLLRRSGWLLCDQEQTSRDHDGLFRRSGWLCQSNTSPSATQAAQDELTLEIERLQEQRARLSLSGALTLMTLGGTATVIGLPVLIYGLAVIGQTSNLLTLMLVGGLLTLPGLIAMIIGIVWFVGQVNQAKRLEKQIKLQKQKRKQAPPARASLLPPTPTILTIRF